MSPPAKRQRLNPGTATTKHAVPTTRKPTSINTFARVSKSAALFTVKEDVLRREVESIDTTRCQKGTSATHKRMREDSPVREKHNYSSTALLTPPSTKRTPTRSSILSRASPMQASLLLTPPPSSSGCRYERKLASCRSRTTQLPLELVDLIHLYSAFLTALSLHYTLNGASSPADLAELCPNTSRVWGKRRIVIKDIQQCLGIAKSSCEKEDTDIELRLSDYGMGKICIDIEVGDEEGGYRPRLVDEATLNRRFVSVLTKHWSAWDQKEDGTIKEFLDTLPLEPITECASLAKIAPMLARGRRRLETMKKAVDKPTTQELPGDALPKMTLLERLRAKQIHKSKLPATPTAAEKVRQATLQRSEEVMSIIKVMSTASSKGQARISFTMATVLSRLQDSISRPISKAESESCIRLLASEIAPEWIQVVKRGKVEAVVVLREGRVEDDEFRKRVCKALGD